MTEWLEKWKSLQQSLFGGAQKSGLLSARVAWMGAVGILLLIFGGVYDGSWSKTPAPEAQKAEKTPVKQAASAGGMAEYALEEKLSQALSRVKGAGTVTVSLTYGGSARQEHEKNRTKETKVVQEKDTSGGVRTTTESKESEQVLMSKESGADKPVTIAEARPEIRGVLVVADGAMDSTVKADLTRAVETGLGVASYKITVLPQGK